MPAPLPTNDDGFIQTSAEYGAGWIVEIEWTTDHDDREIDPTVESYPRTFHGEFVDEAEAKAWLEAYPEFTDIHEMTVIQLNHVRPS